MMSQKNEKRFALIGCPLGHSKSPYIHRRLMETAGIVGDYRLMEIQAGELRERYAAELSSLDGFNVTIPYKTEIIPLLDALSERAQLFGAVNTVAVTKDGSKGYNTDCIGFLRALEGAGIELTGRVLVLGCGGVSRMFAFESVLAGCAVTLAVRESSTKKAQRLVKEIAEKTGKTVTVQLLSELRQGYDLIINGTPVGMAPHPDGCPVSEEVIAASGAVFDAVYNPIDTQLLQRARAHGLRTCGGLPMLVWQAAAAQEIWNGISVSADTVHMITKELEAQR